MLTWEECEELSHVPEDELQALEGQNPSEELIQFVLNSYALEASLCRNPGIKTIIIEDIESARKSGLLTMAALLRLAILYRLKQCKLGQSQIASETTG